MKIEFELNKSINENINSYYEKAKKIRKKIERIQNEVEITKKELKKQEKREMEEYKNKCKSIINKRKKEWYEKFRYFFTSSGKLVLGGKNSSQNEIIYKKYLNETDLVFHADIHGASLIILKDGCNANDEEKKEVAQFAVCFSNFWKNQHACGDAYSTKPSNIIKNLSGMYTKKGSFIIKGKKEYYRNIKLKLKIGILDKKVVVLPANSKVKLEKEIYIIPGNIKKEKIIKKISNILNVHIIEIQELLPSGKCVITGDKH